MMVHKAEAEMDLIFFFMWIDGLKLNATWVI